MSTPHIAGLLLAGSIQEGGYVHQCDPDDNPDPIAVASLTPVSPTPAPIPNTTPAPNQLDFTIRTDSFGEETGWSLFQVTQGVPKLIFSKVPGTYGSKRLITEQYYLDVGKYQLNVTDKFGDGFFCPGYFTISLRGVLLKKKEGTFKSDSTSFTVASVPANPTPNKPISKPAIPVTLKPVQPKPVPNLPTKPVSKPLPNLPTKPISKRTVPLAVKPVLPKPVPPSTMTALKAKKARFQNS
jgi:hypothetical protein